MSRADTLRAIWESLPDRDGVRIAGEVHDDQTALILAENVVRSDGFDLALRYVSGCQPGTPLHIVKANLRDALADMRRMQRDREEARELEAVALDVLLEHFSPVLPYRYEWHAHARRLPPSTPPEPSDGSWYVVGTVVSIDFATGPNYGGAYMRDFAYTADRVFRSGPRMLESTGSVIALVEKGKQGAGLGVEAWRRKATLALDKLTERVIEQCAKISMRLNPPGDLTPLAEPGPWHPDLVLLAETALAFTHEQRRMFLDARDGALYTSGLARKVGEQIAAHLRDTVKIPYTDAGIEAIARSLRTHAPAICTRPAIRNAVLAVPGVTYCELHEYENGACELFVEGGEDRAIGEAMFQHSWAGLTWIGDTAGYYSMRFTRRRMTLADRVHVVEGTVTT